MKEERPLEFGEGKDIVRRPKSPEEEDVGDLMPIDSLSLPSHPSLYLQDVELSQIRSSQENDKNWLDEQGFGGNGRSSRKKRDRTVAAAPEPATAFFPDCRLE